jgi:peptidoglycan/xylan/chitin deacetylase (PgdA/CDA1 family)
MSGKVFIIWDYDTAVGQINSSYPYNFNEERLLEEIENVDKILELAKEFDVRMTFACVGFAAEPGHYPYHVPDQIRTIFSQGHEIASHSWRHEWFPYLQREQIKRSLVRSKSILEECLGSPGAVKGFVPPFSRPMSWYSRGAFSLGDRVFGPWYPGASYGSLLPMVQEAGYNWCRVAYYPIWQKLSTRNAKTKSVKSTWRESSRVVCVPQHYTGFDESARWLLRTAIGGGAVVLIGHPSGLTRSGTENIAHLRNLLLDIAESQQAGTLETSTVSSCVSLASQTSTRKERGEIAESRDQDCPVL